MSLLSFDISRRHALMRAHTATHILHAVLCEFFPQTKQAGSYVGEDELRFDFFADTLLDPSQIDYINTKINRIIYQHHLVTTTETSYEGAIQSGAKAFFEDKYPENVRVVKIQDNSGVYYSVELCGGTHVANTGQIGGFFLTEQSTVAAGVKRIVALTGPKLAQYLISLQKEKEALADKVGVPSKQLDAKIEKIIGENQEISYKFQKLSSLFLANKEIQSARLGGILLDIVWYYEGQGFVNVFSFSEVISYLKSEQSDKSWLLYSDSGQYALFHIEAKNITKQIALSGGGSDSFIQGKDKNILQMIS